MPKICQADKCKSNCFGGGYCKYHQYLRRMKGGDQYQHKLPHKLPNKLPRRTKHRADDERYYAVQAKEFFEDAVNNGTNHCVFCGEKVTKFEGLHHWRGRTNDYLLDNKYWSVVHNDCHLFYHRATVEQMKQQTWYDAFMVRLKAKDIESYNKQINRSQKEILFKDEDLE